MAKAVSPLIATIILVSLTVAIGGMIIGWGRQYVEQQTICLGLQTDIVQGSLDTATNQIQIFILNTGINEIDATSDASLLRFVASIGGQLYTCRVSTTTPGANECRIQPLTSPIVPGDTAILTIEFGTGINLANFEYGLFVYGHCGEISRKIQRTELI